MPDAEVTEPQLALLLGQVRDPITGDKPGWAYQQFTSIQDRIDEHVAELDPGLSAEEREAVVATIDAQESEKGSRSAVVGYDLHL